MKRSFALFFSVVLLLVVATSAFAEWQSFSKVTVNVPMGWTATENTALQEVTLQQNAGAAVMHIRVASKENNALRTIATFWHDTYNVNQYVATDLQAMVNGSWLFSYIETIGTGIMAWDVIVFDKEFNTTMSDTEYCLVRYSGPDDVDFEQVYGTLSFNTNTPNPTPNPNPTPEGGDEVVGGSGGGCNSGFGIFAALSALASLVMLRRK